MKVLKKRALSKVLVIFSALALLLSTAYAPAYASEATELTAAGKVETYRAGFPITDNNPVTVQILGSVGVFSITVGDEDMRTISVSSDVEVITRLIPVNSAYQSFISFDSVNYRPFSMIARHLIPGAEYELYVLPKTSPANVTISMSKGSGMSWVYNQSGTTFTEKNILFGGKTETYGLAFQTPGTYRITVTTGVSKLVATFTDSRIPTQSEVKPSDGISFGSSYVFQKTITATGYSQDYYGLSLYSKDSPGTGAPYTVIVEKI